MKLKKYLVILLLFSSLHAQERSWLAMAQDLYSRMLDGVERQDWKYTIHHGRLLATRFTDTPYGNDANYYIGLAHYSTNEYAHANRFFSEYLKKSSNPKFFEEALLYKFDIATKYEAGFNKRLFGKKPFPKIAPSKEEALDIYDEVITSMPRHDVAVQATFRKAGMLARMHDYKLAIETYQTLIRRYPKHDLAPDSYLAISRIFLDQCKREFPDQELLDRADLNLEKFKNHFPSEPRIADAEAVSLSLREALASELYTLGDFYERTKKPRAACIYYSNIVTKYPMTAQATKARKRLQGLKGSFAKVKAKHEKKKAQAVIAEGDFDVIAENDKMVDMIDSLTR